MVRAIWVANPELAVLSQDGPHALVFPCRRILGGWVNAETRKPIELREKERRRV
jgi:hypothetical protein